MGFSYTERVKVVARLGAGQCSFGFQRGDESKECPGRVDQSDGVQHPMLGAPSAKVRSLRKKMRTDVLNGGFG